MEIDDYCVVRSDQNVYLWATDGVPSWPLEVSAGRIRVIMHLFLTSSTFDGPGDWLAAHTQDPRVAVITNASNELDDADAIVGPALEALEGSAFMPISIEVTPETLDMLDSTSAVVITGGNPFRLMDDLRASGADDLLRQAWTEGNPKACPAT